MATSNGIFYSQTQGLKISTNNLNRVIVSTAGTSTFTGSTSGQTVVDVRGSNGQILSAIDNNTGPLLTVNNFLGSTIFQVNSNNSIIGGTPTNNTFVVSGNSVSIGAGLSPSNKLHVYDTLDPVRFDGIQSSFDSRFITSDSNGVLHYRTDVVLYGQTLYTGDGNLTGNRTVEFNGATLLFNDSTSSSPYNLFLSGGNVGIGTIAPTNALTVTATTDPVKFGGIQSALDEFVLTQDANGVVHYRNVNTISTITSEKIVLRTIDLGTISFGGNFVVRNNKLLLARLTDNILNEISSINYSGANIDYYFTVISGNTRQKYFFGTQRLYDQLNAYNMFTSADTYFSSFFDAATLINPYCEIYLDISNTCSAPTQVKLTNTLFNSLNPFKYTRAKAYQGYGEFVRGNYNVSYGEQTIESSFQYGWLDYYNVNASNDILKNIYDIVSNEPSFYGSLSGQSYSAITNTNSWDEDTRDILKASVYVEKNSNFYSKYKIPVNTYGFYDINLGHKNNFYGTLFYDNMGGAASSNIYSNSDQSTYKSAAILQFIDTYRIFASGTPATIYTNSNYDKYTKLNDLTYSMGIDSSLKYLTNDRDKSYVQLLPGYQNVYILYVSVQANSTTQEIEDFFLNFLTEYLVINDPSLNINNDYWFNLYSSQVAYFADNTSFGSNPFGPYIIIQSDDDKMNQLGALGSLPLGDGALDIKAIYKGWSFRPLIYPLNLNQLTLEVPSSYIFDETINDVVLDNTCNNFKLNVNDTLYRSGLVNFDYFPTNSDYYVNNNVYSVDVQSNGKQIFGGDFDTVNGENTVGYIARFNTNGTLDTTFNTGGGGFNGTVYTISIQPNGKIVVGGDFDTYDDGPNGATSVGYMARLNTDGDIDLPFSSVGNGFNSRVTTTAIQSDEKILVGGTFTNFNSYTYGNINFQRIARLNTNGDVDLTFNDLNGGFDDDVRAIAIQSDGKILVGGRFTQYDDLNLGTTTVRRIARLNVDGTIDATFNYGYNSFNNDVLTIAIQPDGKILCGGSFTTYDDNTSTYTVNHIARLNTDGTLDTTFNSGGSGFDKNVNTISIQSDNTILVGGDFGTFSDNVQTWTAEQICNLNSDGNFDLSFNMVDGFVGESSVYCSKIINGLIFVGGKFIEYQSMAGYQNIIALTGKNLYVPQKAGINDAQFIPNGYGFNGPVLCSEILSDGTLFVGGHFDQYSGVTASQLIKLNLDGSRNNDMFSTWFPNSDVNVIKRYRDLVYIGGQFTTYTDNSSTYSVGYIARLNNIGTLDTAFNNGGGGFNDGVLAIAIQSDGKLIVGGYFVAYSDSVNGNIDTQYIARLNVDGTIDTTFNTGVGRGFNDTVRAIAIQPDGKILCGGSFTTYDDSFGSTSTTGIARLNTDGTYDTTFNTGFVGFNDSVTSIAIQNNGQIVCGGLFLTYEDIFAITDVGFIARLNIDGTIDTTFNTGLGYGFNSNVNAVAIQNDGKVLCGGLFGAYNDTVNGSVNIGCMTRLNIDGTLDTTFNASIVNNYYINDIDTAEFNDYVYSLKLDYDGNLYVGGDFTAYNFGTSERFARLFTETADGYSIENKYLRFIIKYTKLQKYDLITVPIKLTNIRGQYDSKIQKITLDDFYESFEMNIYKNLSHSKRKQLRPNSFEVYMGFYDLETNETSMIPNYKIIMTNYGDNEVFKLIRGSVVINSVSP